MVFQTLKKLSFLGIKLLAESLREVEKFNTSQNI